MPYASGCGGQVGGLPLQRHAGECFHPNLFALAELLFRGQSSSTRSRYWRRHTEGTYIDITAMVYQAAANLLMAQGVPSLNGLPPYVKQRVTYLNASVNEQTPLGLSLEHLSIDYLKYLKRNKLTFPLHPTRTDCSRRNAGRRQQYPELRRCAQPVRAGGNGPHHDGV